MSNDDTEMARILGCGRCAFYGFCCVRKHHLFIFLTPVSKLSYLSGKCFLIRKLCIGEYSYFNAKMVKSINLNTKKGCFPNLVDSLKWFYCKRGLKRLYTIYVIVSKQSNDYEELILFIFIITQPKNQTYF